MKCPSSESLEGELDPFHCQIGQNSTSWIRQYAYSSQYPSTIDYLSVLGKNIDFFSSPYIETEKCADPEREFDRGILLLCFVLCDT
jgi:hypothetical protein